LLLCINHNCYLYMPSWGPDLVNKLISISISILKWCVIALWVSTARSLFVGYNETASSRHQAHWEGGQPGRRPGAHELKQVESCFLNHNLSYHFCCTDSLLMTRRGGLSLSIIIWKIGRWRGQVSFCRRAQKFSWRPWIDV
jgi:hypothetical protein